MELTYHDTVKFLQPVKDNPRSPFEKKEWFALIEDTGAEPLYVSIGQDDQSSIMPLARINGRLEALSNWLSFSWRPMGAIDAQQLKEIARDLRNSTHRLVLWPLPEEDGSASTMAQAFRAAGWSVQLVNCHENHILRVQGRSFAEYWATRAGRMRTTLKRKAKKVTTEILTHFDADVWAEYQSIYAESWKPEEDNSEMLRAYAENEGAAGRIRLAVARHEGQAVAAQFWTVEEKTAYIHKLAHLESLKSLSAGTTLTAALFEHVIDQDQVDIVDFGTGNDGYKVDWMEEVRPRYRLDALDPSQPKAWPALAKRHLRRLARIPPQS